MVPSHLKALQALELAVRTGSFAAAAEILSITPAAVGQRVKALEDYLGVELIVRGRAGIRPTAALAEAIPHLAAGFGAIEAAAAALDVQRPQELHIVADEDFAELWLKPRLPMFRAAHPHVRLCLNGEGEAPARPGRVDCEIRFEKGRTDDGSCDALFGDFILPVAAPGIVLRIQGNPQACPLEGLPLLHLEAGPSWARWIEANRMSRAGPERGMRFQSVAAMLKAVHAEAGVGLCGVALIAGEIGSGTVELPFPRATGQAGDGAYLAHYRPPRGSAHMVGRFRDWLKGEAAITEEWLRRFTGTG